MYNSTIGLFNDSEDGDGYNRSHEVALNRRYNDVRDFGFNFYHDYEGWERGGTYTGVGTGEHFPAYSNHWYIYSTGNDPFIFRNDLNLDPYQVTKIQAIVASENTGTFKLYWKTSSENYYSESKSIEISYSKPYSFENLVFNVSANPKWTGNITSLRLDAPSTPGHSWFRSIRFKNNFLYAINPQGITNTEISSLNGNDFYKYKFIH